MDFALVIQKVVGALEAQGIRYALIGGFAMGLRGVQRATMDLDFVLMLEDVEKADEILRGFGYQRVFYSPNVSQYESADRDWGRIDILHAFRGPTLSMIERAQPMPLFDDFTIRVVHTEDIVGLKVQALVNNPARQTKDWADIRMLLEAAGQQKVVIDWELVAEYLRIFHLEGKLTELKEYHGHADQA